MDWECTSKIEALRKSKKLTQLELAQQVGVTETTIANWEKGRSGIEWIDRLIRLCAALECTPEDLLNYIPKPTEGEGSFSEIVQLIAGIQRDDQHSSSAIENSLSSEAIKKIEAKGGSFSEIVSLIQTGQKAQAMQFTVRTIPTPVKNSARHQTTEGTTSKS
ncbi:helix-turn-helix transcriptional regulator [Nodosilinea sp. LEGE 07088]|nr:helix-turn-helix transcriptional regulator [Nodosilinea sp. LEGE 07088]